MNLSQTLNNCWHDVETEYTRGHLNNPSTFAFAFLKSLSACQADLQYFYDGRIIEGLKETIAAPTVGVLLHEFIAGNQLSIPMPVSAGCNFGYFVVSDQDSIGKDHLAAIEHLSEREKSRFHYAYAAIPPARNIAPAGRTQ